LTAPPWEVGQREEFRGRFGEDVDAYDRTRPVAPDAVFDDIVRLAGLRPGSTLVEIGPGTGQATRCLAVRGLGVLALELDPRLAARAARNLAELPQVTVQATSFEAWDPGDRRFDAVLACNSFHWVDPEVGLAKAAGVLASHGSVVLMSTPVVVPDGASQFWWDVQDDWQAVASGRLDPATQHPDLVGDWASAVRSSELFEEPTVIRHPFAVDLSADDYIANLSTQSGVKTLPVPAQGELLRRVEQRIRAEGNTLRVHHLAVVTMARRISPGS
jgi:SAM-dependent methyltransferase